MTKQRNDDHSTEFGLWLRGQLPDKYLDRFPKMNYLQY